MTDYINLSVSDVISCVTALTRALDRVSPIYSVLPGT